MGKLGLRYRGKLSDLEGIEIPSIIEVLENGENDKYVKFEVRYTTPEEKGRAEYETQKLIDAIYKLRPELKNMKQYK